LHVATAVPLHWGPQSAGGGDQLVGGAAFDAEVPPAVRGLPVRAGSNDALVVDGHPAPALPFADPPKGGAGPARHAPRSARGEGGAAGGSSSSRESRGGLGGRARGPGPTP